MVIREEGGMPIVLSSEHFKRVLYAVAGTRRFLRYILERLARFAVRVAERFQRFQRVNFFSEGRTFFSRAEFLFEFKHNLLRGFFTNAGNLGKLGRFV